MAGFAAYMKIDGFNILPVSSISMAATTFVGQNYGAGRLDRVKKGTWVTLAVGVVYTLITGTLLLLGQDAIMHLFTNDETVVFFGEAAMHWFCPFYFLLSILHGLAGAVRGTGASVPPMVVLLVSLCLFRIVWIQWVLPLFSGIEGVFILYPVSWALGAGLMITLRLEGQVDGISRMKKAPLTCGQGSFLVTASQTARTGMRYQWSAPAGRPDGPHHRGAFSSNRGSWRTALPAGRGAP